MALAALMLATMVLLAPTTTRAFTIGTVSSPTPFTTSRCAFEFSTTPAAATSTAMNMVPKGKPMSEWTEEEKAADRERGATLLKVKGAALVLAAVAYFVVQQ